MPSILPARLPSGMLATALLPALLASAPPIDPALAERFARLALACVHQEYPNKIAHVMGSDADARPPRELTPAFYGCYDWHSSVHGHWLLARLARLQPEAPFAADARRALGRSLTRREPRRRGALPARGRAGSASSGRTASPGCCSSRAELREWGSPDASAWSAALEPLERAAALRLREWLPKLTQPIRVGEHSQTAFAARPRARLGARGGRRETRRLVEQRSRDFYGRDRACPLAYEPSGEDFLSPCLGEADLMRRVLPGPDTRVLAPLGFCLAANGRIVLLPQLLVTDPSRPA